MNYQTQLLPTDDLGHFILARHFARYGVGGEDTREAAHALFSIGQVDAPGRLTDLADLCTLPRPASATESERHRSAALIQGELSRSGDYSPSMRENYARNQAAMKHAALLALRDTVWLPRRVASSRHGCLLLGYEQRDAETDALRGTLRLLDIGARRERLHVTALQPRLGQFMALSRDGTRSLGLVLHDGAWRVIESLLEPGLPELATLPGQAMQTALPTREGWLLLTDERALSIEGATGRISAEVALPTGAYAWGAALTPDDALLVLSASNGGLWCVSLQGADKPRRFNPHRGLKRGTTLDVAVSDCGRWLASRAADDLVVTRLADGVSWPVGTLADTVLQEPADGGYMPRSNLRSGFAFIGSRLLCADIAGVREVPLGEPPAGARAIVSETGRPGARVPVSVPANASLDRMLTAARLQAAAPAIEAHHSPALRLTSKPLKKNGWLLPPHAKASPLGASRFGGWPDLPVGTDWPRWQGRPMAFLAQIDLAQAHAVQPGLRLPGRGLLLFFLGCGEDTYAPEGDNRPRHRVHVMAGTEVPGGGAWRVLHADVSTSLQRQALATQPLPELFEPCGLRFAKGGKPLPDEATVAYGRLPLDETQRDDYNDLLAQLAPDGDAADQLMGHPRLLQGTPPELHCELSSRGLNPWLLPQPDDRHRDVTEAGAAEWGLLLQLTSNTDAGFMWGDGGHFYFYGRREALARGDFSGVWVDYEN